MTTLVIGQAFYAVNCRYIWSSSMNPVAWFENRWMFFMILINVGLQCLLVYVPKVQDVWEMTDLDANAWGRVILLSVALFLAVEFEKWFAPRYVFPVLSPLLARFSKPKSATVHDRMSAAAGQTMTAAAAVSNEEKAVATK
jgi:magnesium-transporting ATPase (P-type)